MRTIYALLVLLLTGVCYSAEPSHQLRLAKPGKTLLADDFTQIEMANRRLTRGDWKVAGGIASCAHDDELFKQYKNHGPAIWYDVDYQDAIVRFDFLAAEPTSHFVFTVN